MTTLYERATTTEPGGLAFAPAPEGATSGLVLTRPSGAYHFDPYASPGGAPARPPIGFTMTLGGRTYKVVASDTFPGTTLNPENWYEFQSAHPGAGAVDAKGAPICTWPGNLAEVNNGLNLYAQLGPRNANGNPTLLASGVGSQPARYITGPGAILWCFRRVLDVPGLVDYDLEWPNAGQWPPNQERDHRESDGTASVSHQTIHGSHRGQSDNVAVGHFIQSRDCSEWTVALATTTADAISVFYGTTTADLILTSQVAAIEMTEAGVVAPAGGAIDLTAHAFDMAILLEGVSEVPSDFSATAPSLVKQVAWVCWMTA
jgi:hypothetical protein